MSKRILNVVGARPNFMKMAPIHRLMLNSEIFQPRLVHTGQHYDTAMSKVFFDELGLPEPDAYLGVGSGSHAYQTAEVMKALEKIMLEERPDLVLVVGDVNSTLAASIVAAKLCIPIAHVEAGLRSGDRTMPEEINRILTDSIADFLFITEKSGIDNLKREGIPTEKIFLVGNVMIDSLVMHLKKAQASIILEQLGVGERGYSLVTIHRPANVDNPENLQKILTAFHEIQKSIKIIFPIHPRTRKMIHTFGFQNQVDQMQNLKLIDPVGYFDFVKLMEKSRFVLTDSGGIQEETTFLKIPCLTLRENTERPITIEVGSNILVGMNSAIIIQQSQQIIAGKWKNSQIPELWDGHAAERIVQILAEKL
ncbi:UDP-N-acetylglucosamine 2-epimerase (non-hydrolyzing) [candidate division KSB1 bacterium]|nr:UDP-N-acetylglucosamine 2-epimerase (non-hydrolyzing) [candidate division KSB1 bacterium]